MIKAIITPLISFISTNIDDIFILMLFFTQVSKSFKTKHVVIGQYLGIGILVIISIIASRGVLFLPEKYIGFLGLIPIYLGIKEFIDSKNEEEEGIKETQNLGILKVSAITIANGGDNIGIYIPLFSSMNKEALLTTIIIFTLLTGLWCFLGLKLSKNSFIEGNIKKYKKIIVPIVFIVIGLSILF